MTVSRPLQQTRSPLAPYNLVRSGIESLRTRRALRVARREADAELLLRQIPLLRLAWRAAQLVAPRRRRRLACSLP